MIPSVFKTPTESENCTVDSAVLDSLGLPGIPNESSGYTNYCLRVKDIKIPLESKVYRAQLLASQRGKSEFTELGELEVGILDGLGKVQWPIDFKFSTSSLVFLTSEQKVFSDEEFLKVPDPRDPEHKKQIALDYLIGAVDIQYSAPGTLKLKNGTEKQIYMHMSPDGHRIAADVNGRLRLIFRTDQLWFF